MQLSQRIFDSCRHGHGVRTRSSKSALMSSNASRVSVTVYFLPSRATHDTSELAAPESSNFTWRHTTQRAFTTKHRVGACRIGAASTRSASSCTISSSRQGKSPLVRFSCSQLIILRSKSSPPKWLSPSVRNTSTAPFDKKRSDTYGQREQIDETASKAQSLDHANATHVQGATTDIENNYVVDVGVAV